MFDFWFKKMMMLKNFFKILMCGVFKCMGVFTKKTIIFESYPELDGSPWMLYQELFSRGYGKKYNLVWAVDSSFICLKPVKCVVFFGELSFFQRLCRFYCKKNAKHIIYKSNPNTIRLHTRHGGTLKRVDGYSHAIGEIDYILSLSDEMAEIESSIVYKNAGLNRKQFVSLGYPNNDRLFVPVDQSIREQMKKLFGVDYKKIIGWMPTFRKHKSGGRIDCSKKYPFGVPLLYQIESFERVNAYLKNKGVLLALKIHHAQLLDFPKVEFSNIKVIPEGFDDLRIPMMDLIKVFDALITDYSSIYHEYLLLDRPIALSIDDYNEYCEKTGFSIDYFDWIKGVYLNDENDLLRFIDEVADCVDSAKTERKFTSHRIHKYIDNQSTKRVVDFLEKNAGL